MRRENRELVVLGALLALIAVAGALAAMLEFDRTPIAERNQGGGLPASVSPSPSDPSGELSPEPFGVTLTLSYCMDHDDVTEFAEFFPDGAAGDPTGISAAALWGDDLVKAVLSGSPPGEGWGPDDKESGHWEHSLTRADGTRVETPADPRAYRLHDGDTDWWGWSRDGGCGE